MSSACSSHSIVAWSDVDKQYSVLYVPTVGICVCCDIGWINNANWSIRYMLYGTYSLTWALRHL